MIQSTGDGGVVISIAVVPRASKAGIAGTRGDAVLVRLTAPPVDDAANEELIGILASVLERPRRAVSIVAGAHSRRKRIRVAGIDVRTAEARLLPTAPGPQEG
jgi:uncharacterized protein (TIGR00251 family)